MTNSRSSSSGRSNKGTAENKVKQYKKAFNFNLHMAERAGAELKNPGQNQTNPNWTEYL